MKKFFILLVAFFLVACGNNTELTGTYHSVRNENDTVTFNKDQTLDLYSHRTKTTTKSNYEVNGNVISFQVPIGTWTFTKLNDGSLMLNGVEKHVKN